MNFTIETKAFRGARKHRPVVGDVFGHWTADYGMACREGESIVRALDK